MPGTRNCDPREVVHAIAIWNAMRLNGYRLAQVTDDGFFFKPLGAKAKPISTVTIPLQSCNAGDGMSQTAIPLESKFHCDQCQRKPSELNQKYNTDWIAGRIAEFLGKKGDPALIEELHKELTQFEDAMTEVWWRHAAFRGRSSTRTKLAFLTEDSVDLRYRA
jgi:hypothetical protein